MGVWWIETLSLNHNNPYSIVALYSMLNSTTVTVKGHRVAVSTLISYPVPVGTGLWS